MISRGTFEHSIKEAIQLLKDLDLFKSVGVKDIGDHSDAFKKISRGNRHTEIYNSAIENLDYEILLKDESIFQFSLDSSIRYCFIQNPTIFFDQQDYIKEIFTDDEILEYSIEELLSTIKEEEYEQFLDEQNLNLSANFFRYDVDAKGYIPLLHSYSHIHIGFNENTRISCSKILTPLKFVIFAAKNTYYSEWKQAVELDSSLNTRLEQSKNQCPSVPAAYWKNDEDTELHII
jgi:hypothetical protein